MADLDNGTVTTDTGTPDLDSSVTGSGSGSGSGSSANAGTDSANVKVAWLIYSVELLMADAMYHPFTECADQGGDCACNGKVRFGPPSGDAGVNRSLLSMTFLT
jgi:hypothetical protein